ncbi:TonB-dependent receptor domain-containing protein [Microbulbifer litoralis]|uniref:TonB-dependent receptor domain-containing protein n=1 Tax=Microbulbifer litoralis TaxID=2933965 RepID=UPI00202894B6|nr:TonB-dependent receptor [Microbulbifer sp. GX H0434]
MKKIRKLILTTAPVVSGVLFTHAAVLAQEQSEDSGPEDETSKLEHIQVSGQSYRGLDDDSPLPVTVLAGDELVQRRQGTLGETLNALPGVHLDNFGAGASRPVIRGQTVPRIEVLTDGANVFDASSVSPDHTIVTDPLLLDAIEVLRGPAATRYGGSALNGAINLIDSKIPRALPKDGITGAAEVRLGSGDEEQTAVGRVTAGLGSFAFHAEGSSRSSEDYKVPGEFGADELQDSFADSSNFSLGTSWITDRGYVGAAYTRQDAEHGLPGHSHVNGVCHTHGLDLHCEAHGSYEDPFGSSDDHTAYIDLRSERVDIRADYSDLLPGFDHVRFRGSYTDYVHDEIDGPSRFSRYTNEVWDGRLELTHKPLLGFTGTFGVQYTDGTFGGINVSDLHEPFPDNAYGLDGVADYVTENTAVFLSERRSFGSVDLEFAARKDWREISVTPPPFRATLSPEYEALFTEWYGAEWRQVLEEDYVGSFRERNPGAKHNPFSASLGATWNITDGYATVLSLGHTERAPGVRELYARGNNLATNSYELGLASSNPILEEDGISAESVLETADSIDLTFRKTGGSLEFEVGLFYQDIEDYIFARLIEIETETGTPHNFLIYTPADASFTGIDGQVSYRFSPESRITLFGDYVDTDLKSEDDNLPRIPPGRLGVRYDWTSGPLSANVEYYRTSSQDHIASYETPTDGYNMVNMTVSYGFNNEATELYLRGVNLTDEPALMHTSFVKEQSPLRGRNLVLGLRHQF